MTVRVMLTDLFEFDQFKSADKVPYSLQKAGELGWKVIDVERGDHCRWFVLMREKP